MKKIIIDGKEMSAKEVISTKAAWHAYALAHIHGLLKPEAEAKAKAATDKEFEDLSMCEFYCLEADRVDEFFINAYLENAENDLVIDSAEVQMKEDTQRKEWHKETEWQLEDDLFHL